jgi:hypothetical protein
MLPDVFPSAADKERLSLVQKYQDLHENKAFAVLGLHKLILKQFKNADQLVYIAHAIPAKISEFYGDFIQGDSEDVVIESSSEDQQQKDAVTEAVDYNDLKEMVYDLGEDQSKIGYVPLLVRLEDGNIVIEAVPQDQYFPQPDGSVIFASYVAVPGGDPKRDIWLYIQHYLLDDKGSAVINRSLWTTDDKGCKNQQVSLAKYDSKLSEHEELNIKELPVMQIDNGSRKGGFGKSDYADILPQLSEINERTTHVAIQLLKNLDAKMQGPRGAFIDENGNYKQFEAIELDSKDMPDVKYILNDNPLIQETYSHVEKQVYYISWITAVPMFELLASAARPERVESLRIRLYSALRKTSRKRAKIRQALDWALRVGLMLKGIPDPEKITIKFGNVLPVDELAEAQVEDVKVRDGLTSKLSAIKRLENCNDEDAEEELRLIEQEARLAGINPANPPQLP